MSNKYCCFAVVKLCSYRCVAGFKSRFDCFYYHSVFTGFHCPLCVNVDEWLHVEVCSDCLSCDITTILLLWRWVGVLNTFIIFVNSLVSFCIGLYNSKRSLLQRYHNLQVHLRKLHYGEKGNFYCSLFQKVKLSYILESLHVK